MEYALYLKSEKWQRKKNQYWRSHKRVCRSCGSTEELHLHHATYDRLGDERLEDLVPLCIACHESLHRMFVDFSEMSLEDFTHEFCSMRTAKETTTMTVRQKARMQRDKEIRSKKKIRSWNASS